MKKRELLSENNIFRLVKQQRVNKTWYEIQICCAWYKMSEDFETEIANYFGTSRNKYTKTWRFWNRLEAHKQFTYASLKWC
jgi:glucan phosphoethanolaminetransferase (alkaline phosphatase superfamily)